jgi:hypothetical protein
MITTWKGGKVVCVCVCVCVCGFNNLIEYEEPTLQRLQFIGKLLNLGIKSL